jgi:hypothetical protein
LHFHDGAHSNFGALTAMQNPHERARDARAKAEAATTDVERTKWLEIAETWENFADSWIANPTRLSSIIRKARISPSS